VKICVSKIFHRKKGSVYSTQLFLHSFTNLNLNLHQSLQVCFHTWIICSAISNSVPDPIKYLMTIFTGIAEKL